MAHLKTTWHHVRRSPYQALAAILIMMVTFLTVSSFAFLLLGSSRVISYFETRPNVTAFFRDDAKQESIQALEDDLRATKKVSSLKFISKEQALAIYKAQNKGDPLLLDLVTADILPASLEISTYSINDLPGVSKYLKASPIVSEVVFQQDVVNTLTAWSNALRKIGLALILGLGVVSILIMSTIVSIKVSQKREEIEIMRLLGATKFYVSIPFIMEGVLYGVIGALYGWAVASIGLWYITPFLESFLRGIPILPVAWLFLFQLLGVEILLAVLLGIFSSWMAVGRYLK